MRDYEARFEQAGIILRDDQLHMVTPKNDFPVYAAGFDPEKTQLSIDAHGQTKGARPWSVETYLAPRIGSYGPDWSKEIPLAPNHHFVLEYFFYMPSPGPRGPGPVPAVVGSRGGHRHGAWRRVSVTTAGRTDSYPRGACTVRNW